MAIKSRLFWSSLTIALVLVLATACKKKSAPEANADAAPANTAPDAAAATAAPQPAQAPVRQIDFKPIQQLVAHKDYDKATQEMLMLQRAVKDPTPDQSMAIANQMRSLQRTLGAAAASGDANAKAAIERLTANMSGR